MRTRKTRSLRGGKVIGIGTQGCVFSPKLVKHTRKNGKIVAKKSENSKKISKVFFDEDTFNREISMLYTISKITNGIGTVIYAEEEDPIYSANFFNTDTLSNLHAAIVTNNHKSSGACNGVQYALNRGEKIYILNQQRVLGDIRDLKTKQPLSFFCDAYTALILLKKYNIIHTDIYARNIFYNEDGALIGDFGHAKDVSKMTESDKTGISKNFLKENNDILRFIRAITPYVKNTKEDMAALIASIESNNYVKFYEMAKIPIHSLWLEVIRYLRVISH
jgi:serine/threonine protein kinase